MDGELESMFTGLTRQQGASKHHISQIQISLESRCVKNTTLAALTESMLRAGWESAKKVKEALKAAAGGGPDAPDAAEPEDPWLRNYLRNRKMHHRK